MNVRFRELWHLTPDEDPAAVDWAQDVHPDDRERVLQGWAAAVDGDGAYESGVRRRGDGRSCAPTRAMYAVKENGKGRYAQYADIIEPAL